MTRPPKDEAVVARFLDLTRNMSVREAGQAADVSHAAVANYRTGDWQRLYPSTREKLEAASRRLAGESAQGEAWAHGLLKAADELEATAKRLRAEAQAILSARPGAAEAERPPSAAPAPRPPTDEPPTGT